jgi:peptidyl-prolyl cis-trans isomerase A (cyclophilin A)
MRKQLIVAVSAAACLLLAGCSSSNEPKAPEDKKATTPAPSTPPAAPDAKKTEPTSAPEPKKEEPKEAKKEAPKSDGLPAQAPATFKVNMETSKGQIVMECHKEWAPRGAAHFYDLVKLHFYDGARFFRVIKTPRPFMAQFGMAGDPKVNAQWASANIPDDPSTGHHNTRGMVSYGQTGLPNSRSTQLFINYNDNSPLDAQGFPPVCEVTTGMDVADQFYGGYGDSPDQGQIGARGNAYLNGQFPKLDYIVKATIVLQ